LEPEEEEFTGTLTGMEKPCCSAWLPWKSADSLEYEVAREDNLKTTFHHIYHQYFPAVLPGGRISGQKAQKSRKKRVVRKKSWPNFGRILPKMAEKGPKKIF
jgi:hypothetical protein